MKNIILCLCFVGGAVLGHIYRDDHQNKTAILLEACRQSIATNKPVRVILASMPEVDLACNLSHAVRHEHATTAIRDGWEKK
mgnify:CR=1 FL=1